MYKKVESNDSSSSDNEFEITFNRTSNVIALFRLQQLQHLASTNFFFAVLSLIYLGVNLALIVFNYLSDDCTGRGIKSQRIKSADQHSIFEAQCGSPISVFTFHTLEFTATFFFSVLQACALLYSCNGARGAPSTTPGQLRFVMFFSVGVSFIPALLIWINMEAFETAAHEIEYANEVTMSSIDIVLFLAIMRTNNKASNANDVGNDAKKGYDTKNNSKSSCFRCSDTGSRTGSNGFCIAFVALCVALAQLWVYNARGVDEKTGERHGEKDAHYLEFVFEVISATITFFFCMESRRVAELEISRIVYGGAGATVTKRRKHGGTKENQNKLRKHASIVEEDCNENADFDNMALREQIEKKHGWSRRQRKLKIQQVLAARETSRQRRVSGLHRDHTDDEEAGKRIMERIELDLEQELRGGRSGMSSVSGRLLR